MYNKHMYGCTQIYISNIYVHTVYIQQINVYVYIHVRFLVFFEK